MPKVTTRARKLRLNRQAQLGRLITLEEVAQATGIERAQLSRIELGKTRGIEFETLAKLCDYYGVGVESILEYDPNTRTPSHAAALPLA